MVIKFKNIVVSSTGTNAVQMISKLFELGFCPEQISVLTYDYDKTTLLNFCKKYQISVHTINGPEQLEHFVKNNQISLLLNLGGMPYLIPKKILETVQTPLINLHTGIIQQNRGRWVVSWNIINNDTHCGYTWHHINDKFDSGNIILQKKFEIRSNDTAFNLNHLLINHAISNLDKVIENANNPGIPPDALGTYYDKNIPFDGVIQDNWTDQQVDRFIRALFYPSKTGAIYKGQEIFSLQQYLDLKFK